MSVLDATLRDGSYCVDFQFTAADTALLVSMLDAAGVGFIEIGHGSGSFNHKAPGAFKSDTRQAATDAEYFAAARASARHAKVGVITGTFAIDDLQLVAEHRLDFVRLACMADRALDPDNLELASRAKTLGLTFSVNLMQTTAITPSRLREVATEFIKAGADWIYVVDSSGGLLPQAVTDYVSCIRDLGITVGYHAHHNSGLAIANCLAAIEAGATMVDGTLQGLGRDVGNAPTEQLLFILQRLGHERHIDADQVGYISDLVRELLCAKGNDSTFFASGIAEVHSSNVMALVELARSRGVGPRSFLSAIAQGSTKLIGAGMKTFPDSVVDPALAKATRASDPAPRPEVVDIVANEITRTMSVSIDVATEVLFARAAKAHGTSVLHLVPDTLFPFEAPLPWRLDALVGMTIGVDPARAVTLELGERAPHVIVTDRQLTLAGATPAGCYRDSFQATLVEAALALATACTDEGKRAWITCADSGVASRLTQRASELDGELVRVLGPDETSNEIAAADSAIVVGYRTVPAWLAASAARGTRLLRPALASCIAARIAAMLDIRARLSASRSGELVDAMVVPAAGELAVDDTACPTTALNDDGRGDAAKIVAAARVRALMRGKGQL